MRQDQAVRLERFWSRLNVMLQDLSAAELQRLLDGLDVVWASAWRLVNTDGVVSSFTLSPTPEKALGVPRSNPALVRKIQDRVRQLTRECAEHPTALESLIRTDQLMGILARHDVDVPTLLASAFYDVDLTNLNPYTLMRACEFRSYAPELGETTHRALSTQGLGRRSYFLARSEHFSGEQTEGLIQDIRGQVASLVELLHFARQHSDLGEHTLTILALAGSWFSTSRGEKVCAAMTYQDGERHLGCIPVKNLDCRAHQVRILAWRKPTKE